MAITKVSPEQLRKLARDIERQQGEFKDVLGAEPKIREHLNEAGKIAAKRYREVEGHWPDLEKES